MRAKEAMVIFMFVVCFLTGELNVCVDYFKIYIESFLLWICFGFAVFDFMSSP